MLADRMHIPPGVSEIPPGDKLMSRNYERDDRENYWRRQEQNRQSQDRWSTGREDEYGWGEQGQEGRNWRGDEDYNRRAGQEMGGRGIRGQAMYGQWSGGGERERWEGGDRGWDRGNERWQGGRAGGWQGRGTEGEYGGPQYGRGNWERTRASERETFGGGGGWNQERAGWNEGFNERMRRGYQGQYAGRGPRSYKRSDNRIEEDINDRLTQHDMIDASDVEVNVQNGEVTLRGHVDRREAKRLAEDIAESVFGVKEVHNQIKIKQTGETEESRRETETSGKQRKAS